MVSRAAYQGWLSGALSGADPREEYVDLLEAVSKALGLSRITMEFAIASQTLRFVGCQVTPRQRDSDHCDVDVRVNINS